MWPKRLLKKIGREAADIHKVLLRIHLQVLLSTNPTIYKSTISKKETIKKKRGREAADMQLHLQIFSHLATSQKH